MFQFWPIDKINLQSLEKIVCLLIKETNKREELSGAPHFLCLIVVMVPGAMAP